MYINGLGSLYNTIFSKTPVTNYREMAQSHERLNEILFMSLLTSYLLLREECSVCQLL